MTTNHTPTPYRIGDAGRTIFGPPNGTPSPVTVARLPDVSRLAGNAAFIVTACNAHDELVAALREAEATLRAIAPHNKYPDGSVVQGPSQLLQRIRAALAKVQS